VSKWVQARYFPFCAGQCLWMAVSEGFAPARYTPHLWWWFCSLGGLGVRADFQTPHHKVHQGRPTGKEHIPSEGAQVIEESFAGGQAGANEPVVLISNDGAQGAVARLVSLRLDFLKLVVVVVGALPDIHPGTGLASQPATAGAAGRRLGTTAGNFRAQGVDALDSLLDAARQGAGSMSTPGPRAPTDASGIGLLPVTPLARPRYAPRSFSLRRNRSACWPERLAPEGQNHGAAGKRGRAILTADYADFRG
jgi:hypothetical protein